MLDLESLNSSKLHTTHYSECVRACVLSHFSHVWLLATIWTVARQAPLSMGFSRQEYWSVFPCPPPGDLPDPGMEPTSPALGRRFFTTIATWEALHVLVGGTKPASPFFPLLAPSHNSKGALHSCWQQPSLHVHTPHTHTHTHTHTHANESKSMHTSSTVHSLEDDGPEKEAW